MSMNQTFTPFSEGCGAKCPINLKEEEICCDNSRKCCFFCMENCPIKEEYNEIIKKSQENLKSKKIIE